MSARFRRASIAPFDEAGKETLDDQAVPFDFNPETLTLKTSSGQSRDRARQGRQQVQNVGASSATLSFEAVFDSTRPRDGEDGRAALQEELDVRLRTRPLAMLIQAAESPRGGGAGGSSSGKAQPAPRRVQFRWGSIVFNGLITSYQETFDYFSPGGVPLRSKVQVTITEQEFRYEIDSGERARARAASTAPAGLRDAAGAAGAESLFDLGAGGFSLGLSAGFSTSSAGASLQAELGIAADIGLSAAAGVSLSADAALDVFGSAALGMQGAAAGRAGLGGGTDAAPRGGPPVTPSPWAPDGPAPGSRAAGLTALVAAQRAAGTALAAPNTPAAPTPLAPRGSPPPVLPRAPVGAVPPALRSVPREAEATGERRPRWEALGAAPRFMAAADAHAPRAGCGCARCGGG
jgi:hypothetical protein